MRHFFRRLVLGEKKTKSRQRRRLCFSGCSEEIDPRWSEVGHYVGFFCFFLKNIIPLETFSSPVLQIFFFFFLAELLFSSSKRQMALVWESHLQLEFISRNVYRRGFAVGFDNIMVCFLPPTPTPSPRIHYTATLFGWWCCRAPNVLAGVAQALKKKINRHARVKWCLSLFKLCLKAACWAGTKQGSAGGAMGTLPAVWGGYSCRWGGGGGGGLGRRGEGRLGWRGQVPWQGQTPAALPAASAVTL